MLVSNLDYTNTCVTGDCYGGSGGDNTNLLYSGDSGTGGSGGGTYIDPLSTPTGNADVLPGDPIYMPRDPLYTSDSDPIQGGGGVNPIYIDPLPAPDPITVSQGGGDVQTLTPAPAPAHEVSPIQKAVDYAKAHPVMIGVGAVALYFLYKELKKKKR